MDTVIFLLIFSCLWAWLTRRRGLGLGLFFAALVATLGLFRFHVTSSLGLSF